MGRGSPFSRGQRAENHVMIPPIPPLTRVHPILAARGAPACETASRTAAQSNTPPAYTPPSDQTRKDHIHRRLGHIIVNPHNAHNTAALVDSYTFLNKSERGTVANSSEDAGRQFIEELIRAARKQFDFIHDSKLVDPTGQSLATQNLFVLHGARGAGKTIFLNYLLSRYSDVLDRERVIWVRLNLVEDFGTESDLTHWIYAQITKIIFRYYDPHSELFDRERPKPHTLDLFRPLCDHIGNSELPEAEQAHRYEKLEGFRGVFYSYRTDEPITPELVPLGLGRRVAELAQLQGYAFIVVLDGLDRLDVTTTASTKFERLIHQVMHLSQSHGRSAMTFAAVCRSSTRDALESANVDPFKSKEAREYLIEPVPLSLILDKRAAYLRREVQELASRYEWNLADWPAHLDDFLTTFDSDQLANIFGGNIRAQMQMVQLQYHEYLHQRHEKAYLLTECLAKMGHRYPPRAYLYAIDGAGKWVRRTADRSFFDSRFLPSIFSPPLLRRPEQSELESAHEHAALLGVRILQLVRAHERNRHRDADPLYGNELAEICSTIFGYPEELTLSLLEEYGEYEFVALKGRDFARASSTHYQQIEPLPKLSAVLDKFLFDLTYLALAAMRMPVSCAALAAKPPYLYSGSPDTRSGLLQWITVKLLNPVALVRLVRAINDSQRGLYAQRVHSVRSERVRACLVQAERDGMFEFPVVMERSVRAQAWAMLESIRADRSRGPEVVNDLLIRLSQQTGAWP